MGKYLITGSPGVGKTSVVEELTKRGYKAYNTDNYREITWFDDLQTGKPLKNKPPATFDPTRHGWNWRLPALKKLLNSAKNVFVSGVTSNTIENLDLFDKVFVLHIGLDTLKDRLTDRANNDFGKHPDELREVLKDHDGSDIFWKNKGAIIINAEQPIIKVVDDILAHINEK